MKSNQNGFTLIEIVVVLVLISIVAATIFTRSITSHELNLISRAEKVQNHIRYAQSMAMKTGEVWGIFSTIISGKKQYWLFRGYKFADLQTPRNLPAENTGSIMLAGSGIQLNLFVLYFDTFGRPYTKLDLDNPDPPNTEAVTATKPLTITITSEEDGLIQREFSITPETGLIVAIQ